MAVAFKLACGHWLAVGAVEARALAGTEASCPDCGAISAVSGKGRESNGSPAKLKAYLEGADAQPSPTVSYRKDGLAVFRFTDRNMRWWCYFCDGRKPEQWRRGRAASIDDVYLGWDVHRITESHLKQAADRSLADRVAEAVRDALGE